MKHPIFTPIIFSLLLPLLALAPEILRADGPLNVHPPTLDSDGRFWIYRNGPLHPKMPFTPYGWMSDVTNLSQIIQVDLECRDNPNTVIQPPTPEKDFCIRMQITWNNATWASVGFISGKDKPPWWGNENTGTYYNLGVLPKKRLTFYARGKQGGEVIKAQIGALCDKPYGDSVAKPISRDVIQLTQDWRRYEIDFKDVSTAELASICNGFSVVVERASQSGSSAATEFYLDDIYFE